MMTRVNDGTIVIDIRIPKHRNIMNSVRSFKSPVFAFRMGASDGMPPLSPLSVIGAVSVTSAKNVKNGGLKCLTPMWSTYANRVEARGTQTGTRGRLLPLA